MYKREMIRDSRIEILNQGGRKNSLTKIPVKSGDLFLVSYYCSLGLVRIHVKPVLLEIAIHWVIASVTIDIVESMNTIKIYQKRRRELAGNENITPHPNHSENGAAILVQIHLLGSILILVRVDEGQVTQRLVNRSSESLLS